MPSAIPYCNSHTHLNFESETIPLPEELSVISLMAGEISDFEKQLPSTMLLTKAEDRTAQESTSLYVSVGVHPWTVATLTDAALESQLAVVDGVLARGRKGELPYEVVAVGECGFDLYGEDRRNTYELQHTALHAHMELARQYGKPLVLHCVKGVEQLLKHHNDLKNLPAVIFHGYGGSINEAETFLRRGINAYFSFGPAILSDRGWPPRVVASLPQDRILLETDGKPVDLDLLYARAAELRCSSPSEASGSLAESPGSLSLSKGPADDFPTRILQNFQSAYGLPSSR